MKKTILVLSAAAALIISGCASHEAEVKAHEQAEHAAHGDEHENHWDYSENGPAHWEEFSQTCGLGHAQSPINIVPGKSVEMNHQYDLSMHEDIHTTAAVIDNGHSIKVTPKTGGTITLHGEEFTLLQFHFHGKSEHTVDGKRFDMVAHMVHQNPETKQLSVVAVFFKEGKANPMLNSVINNIGGEIDVDPQDLLPKETAHYFHYIGSLTTPPCSENVQWYLLKEPVEASKEQIEAFRKFYVDNERPVQELYDRVIESN
ncbi:MAG: carbonic anhydrase family protein [Helicobacteraceae bacterium]|jgi:carbonic anhydrase|nr:carbonic anhydrase family protein [Helicobacteraceae bacterium]